MSGAGDSDADGPDDRTVAVAVDRFEVPVRGVGADERTRCAHYGTARDVVAIRPACCGTFYPCIDCHDALADHEAVPWPADRFDARAVLCGRCGTVLTVAAYLETDHRCPACGGAFNPGCEAHYDRYFAVEDRGAAGTKRDADSP